MGKIRTVFTAGLMFTLLSLGTQFGFGATNTNSQSSNSQSLKNKDKKELRLPKWGAEAAFEYDGNLKGWKVGLNRNLSDNSNLGIAYFRLKGSLPNVEDQIDKRPGSIANPEPNQEPYFIQGMFTTDNYMKNPNVKKEGVELKYSHKVAKKLWAMFGGRYFKQTTTGNGELYNRFRDNNGKQWIPDSKYSTNLKNSTTGFGLLAGLKHKLSKKWVVNISGGPEFYSKTTTAAPITIKGKSGTHNTGTVVNTMPKGKKTNWRFSGGLEYRF